MQRQVRSGSTVLPDWLKQLAAECPPEDRAALDRALEERTMSDKDPTIAARTGRYKAAQEEKGLVAVRVWVPKERRQELIEYAQGLKKRDA